MKKLPKRRKSQKKKKIRAGWKKDRGGYVYRFSEKLAKKYRLKEITFVGFKSKPSGLYLYDSGGGFNWRQSNKIGGNYLLDFLASKYSTKQIRLIISSSASTLPNLTVTKGTVSVRISFSGFLEIVGNLGSEIKKDKEKVISKRLARHFKDFDSQTKTPVSERLSDINLTTLGEDEHKSISSFIKHYLTSATDRNAKEILQKELVIQGQKETLVSVISQFEKHLKDQRFDEKKWQTFLHEEVFFFMSNYIYSIREADVNFGKKEEKKPDFVWIDIYGFLDIFEIKTPRTDLLARRIDKSHKNYYFSSETSRAISQIEKYILFLEQNVENFEKHLTSKTKIPFSVLKPKAILIIGNSNEFEKNLDKKRDFRLLRRTCKNTEFVTFNELLDNLKNLSSKFDREQ